MTFFKLFNADCYAGLRELSRVGTGRPARRADSAQRRSTGVGVGRLDSSAIRAVTDACFSFITTSPFDRGLYERAGRAGSLGQLLSVLVLL
jgi:hypothetical protein